MTSGDNSSERVQQFDEARSYREMLTDAWNENIEYCFLGIALFLLFLFFVYLGLLYHVHIAELAVVAQAEQDTGQTVAEGLPWHYLHAAMTAVGGLAGLWEYSRRRAAGGPGV